MVNSIFTVAKYEFLRFVKTKSFYLTIVILSLVPLAVFAGIGKLVSTSDITSGIAHDASHKIGILGLNNVADNTTIIYDTKEQGLAALTKGDITKFIVFPPNHIETGKCEEYVDISQNRTAWVFGSVSNIVINSIALPSITLDGGQNISKRVSEGYKAAQITIDSTGAIVNISPKKMAFGISMAIVFLSFLFFMVVSSYITDVIIKDKTEKVTESILSSISSFSFITGRVIASCGAALIQAVSTMLLISLLLTTAIASNPTTTSSIINTSLPTDSISHSISNSLFSLPHLGATAFFGTLLMFLISLFFCISFSTLNGTISPRNAIAGRFAIIFWILLLGSLGLVVVALSTPTPILNYIPFISIPVVIALIASSQISFLGFIISLVINLSSAIFVYYLAIKIYGMNFTMAGKSLVSIKDIMRAIK
jgi:ABC-type Na+ efflux pump permease subunit